MSSCLLRNENDWYFTVSRCSTSFYCDGLYRRLPSYDFVGMMDENFYNDLNRMGVRYGERMMNGLESTFHLKQALSNATKNHGIETSASSHVFEYYTPKSVRRVLEYMAMDYVTLNMSIPEWAEQILKLDGKDPSTQPRAAMSQAISTVTTSQKSKTTGYKVTWSVVHKNQDE